MKLAANGAFVTQFIRTQTVTDVAKGMPDLTLGAWLSIVEKRMRLKGDSNSGFELEEEPLLGPRD